MFTVIWFFVGLACIPIAATVANRRERRGWPWGIVAAVAGPVAVLVVALLPGGRRCPHCRRHVIPGATACGHCGRGVPAAPSRAKPAEQTFALGESWPTSTPDE